MSDDSREPHHGVRMPHEVSEDLHSSGLEWPDNIAEQVADALDTFAKHAQRPVEAPTRFPRVKAYAAGMREFRNPDGLGPSLSWPKPLDQYWCDGHYRANALTGWRFEMSGRERER